MRRVMVQLLAHGIQAARAPVLAYGVNLPRAVRRYRAFRHGAAALEELGHPNGIFPDGLPRAVLAPVGAALKGVQPPSLRQHLQLQFARQPHPASFAGLLFADGKALPLNLRRTLTANEIDTAIDALNTPETLELITQAGDMDRPSSLLLKLMKKPELISTFGILGMKSMIRSMII